MNEWMRMMEKRKRGLEFLPRGLRISRFGHRDRWRRRRRGGLLGAGWSTAARWTAAAAGGGEKQHPAVQQPTTPNRPNLSQSAIHQHHQAPACISNARPSEHKCGSTPIHPTAPIPPFPPPPSSAQDISLSLNQSIKHRSTTKNGVLDSYSKAAATARNSVESLALERGDDVGMFRCGRREPARRRYDVEVLAPPVYEEVVVVGGDEAWGWGWVFARDGGEGGAAEVWGSCFWLAGWGWVEGRMAWLVVGDRAWGGGRGIQNWSTGLGMNVMWWILLR